MQITKQILDVNESYFIFINRILQIYSHISRIIIDNNDGDNNDDLKIKKITSISLYEKYNQDLLKTIKEIEHTFKNVENLSDWIQKNVVSTKRSYRHC